MEKVLALSVKLHPGTICLRIFITKWLKGNNNGSLQ